MKFSDATESFLENLIPREEFIEEESASRMASKEEVADLYDAYWKPGFKVYVNDAYRVEVYDDYESPTVWLVIQNLDGSANRDWRDFQEIKNTLVGPKNEGIELYPSEDRKRDMANVFHLFVLRDESAELPFGAPGRRVSSIPPRGYTQRP